MKSRFSVLEFSVIGEAEGREGTGGWRSAEASKTDLAEDLGPVPKKTSGFYGFYQTGAGG